MASAKDTQDEMFEIQEDAQHKHPELAARRTEPDDKRKDFMARMQASINKRTFVENPFELENDLITAAGDNLPDYSGPDKPADATNIIDGQFTVHQERPALPAPKKQYTLSLKGHHKNIKR